MRIRNAFTMIELIFVIVVMGIIGSFGAEFLAQSYSGFIYSKINNSLQSSSATTVEFVASRLQHRIKDSVIVRTGETPAFTPLANAAGEAFDVLEWVSTDVDGFRGQVTPYWSGIIDLAHTDQASNILVSPATNTALINTLIDQLSDGDSTVNDAALFFIGGNSDVNGYGWDGNPLGDQTSVMHPIQWVAGQPTQFATNTGVNDFAGLDVYEYYKLSWTANAIYLDDYNATTNMGTLKFYYDYQPWNGQEFYNHGKSFTIMENVSTFQSMAIGSIIKIQVCTKSLIVDGNDPATDIGDKGYSLCKEKTIF